MLAPVDEFIVEGNLDVIDEAHFESLAYSFVDDVVSALVVVVLADVAKVAQHAPETLVFELYHLRFSEDWVELGRFLLVIVELDLLWLAITNPFGFGSLARLGWAILIDAIYFQISVIF